MRVCAAINSILSIRNNNLRMISQSDAYKAYLASHNMSTFANTSRGQQQNEQQKSTRSSTNTRSVTSRYYHKQQHRNQSVSTPADDTSNILLRLTILRHGQTTANAEGIIQGQQPHWPLTDVGIMQAKMGHEELVRMSMEKSHSYFWRAYSSDLLRAKHTAEIALGYAPENVPLSHGIGNNNDAANETINYSKEASIALPKPLLCHSESLRLDARLREYALGVREGQSISLSWKEAAIEWKKKQSTYSKKEGGLNDAKNESQRNLEENTKLPCRESVDDVHRRTLSFLHYLIEEVRNNFYDDNNCGQEKGGMQLHQHSQQPHNANDQQNTQFSTQQHQVRNPPNVLLASHGGCIKVFLESSLGFPSECIGKLQNGSLTQVDILSTLPLTHNPSRKCAKSEDNVIYDAKVECWYRLGTRVNDVRHLEGHELDLLQEANGGHSLDSLYGALGDDSSAAMEK